MKWLLLGLTVYNLVGLPLLFCSTVWMMICIYRTHIDIIRIIAMWAHRPVTVGALSAALDSVSFNQHLRARVLGRDPIKLYPEIIQDSISNPRTEIIHTASGEPSDMPQETQH